MVNGIAYRTSARIGMLQPILKPVLSMCMPVLCITMHTAHPAAVLEVVTSCDRP